MHRYLHGLKLSLITWVLGLSTHGAEVNLSGLNIEQILSPSIIGSNIEVPENTVHLDVMLRHYPFSTSIIDDQVAANLIEHPLALSDTDESTEDKIQNMSQGITVKFASKFSVDQSQVPLKASEIDHSQSPDQIARDLCRKLAQDAFHIANAHKSARTREATTCLCVVLRDGRKRAKKLVFHNSTGEMQASMRQKANDLGYGIRNAHLAHAEVQLIDFLAHRTQQRADEMTTTGLDTKPKYTHILGMGCSKKHCQECNIVCKLFLGKDYAKFTAAPEKADDEASMPVIEALGQEHKADLRMTIPATTQDFKIVWQKDAIRSGSSRSANYRLPGTMQQRIQGKSGLTLDFTDARFNLIGHTITQPSTEAVLLPTGNDGIDITDEQETEDSEALKPPPEKKKKANP